MAIVKAVSSKASIKTALNYVMKEEKTKGMVSGINIFDPSDAAEQMQLTKKLWNKTGGRTYMHFVHSYSEHENITAEQAHQNAIELVETTEAWKGFEVIVATHVDRKHIHSHIIINSVNMETGYKLQFSPKNLEELKKRCEEQSRKQGLHVPEKGKTFFGEDREETMAWKKNTYAWLKKAEKGEVKSYVQDIALAIMDCKEEAISRDDFISKMKDKGYDVSWQDNHKYITFTDLERQQKKEKKCKIRNNKLAQYYGIDFGKECLENEFEINARRYKQTEAEATARANATDEIRRQIDRLDIGTGLENRQDEWELPANSSDNIADAGKNLQIANNISRGRTLEIGIPEGTPEENRSGNEAENEPDRYDTSAEDERRAAETARLLEESNRTLAEAAQRDERKRKEAARRKEAAERKRAAEERERAEREEMERKAEREREEAQRERQRNLQSETNNRINKGTAGNSRTLTRKIGGRSR